MTNRGRLFVGERQKVVESSELKQHVHVVFISTVSDPRNAGVRFGATEFFLGYIFVSDCLVIKR